MQRIIEELTNARGHMLIARNHLWGKRGELPDLDTYKDTRRAIALLEWLIWTLEHQKEETCEKS